MFRPGNGWTAGLIGEPDVSMAAREAGGAVPPLLESVAGDGRHYIASAHSPPAGRRRSPPRGHLSNRAKVANNSSTNSR